MNVSAFRAAAVTLLWTCAASAQSAPAPEVQEKPAAPATPSKPTAEMSTREEAAVFRTRVNLVVVPVVVRDKKGIAVGNLKQEDFQLFDRGKPQFIARFSMERAGNRLTKVNGAKPAAPESLLDEKPPEDLPDRFIAYLFDDIHMEFGDLARVRDSAGRHIDSGLHNTDRAAIYTTSGQTIQDFTDDKALLHAALGKLRMRPVTGQGASRCPTMTYYMADQIQNKNDPTALQASTLDVISCMNLDPQQDYLRAQQIAKQAAQSELTLGDHETRLNLGVVEQLIRRMAAMPGQRSIILVSNGFVTLAEHKSIESDIIDRAVRSNVLINALDARGLYTDTPDIRRATSNFDSERVIQQMERETRRAQSDVLAELSAGTGAGFFQNSNDLDGGFARLATAPEYYYLLSFSPQNLKMDGTFHALKVTLKNVKDIGVASRNGYYAPRHSENAAETAKREIEEALFSREEMTDIPVEMHTQFFKVTDDKARISVLVKVEVKRLKFRREDDRNCNELTIVAGLFDRNGVYATGNQKRIDMRLLDETVEKRLGTGLTVRSSFDVKPGTYSVRLVVRDAEGQLMTAQNGTVDIPY
ncbi:MAG: VWA domain-containing protein [Candidatus Solibacter sp.]